MSSFFEEYLQEKTSDFILTPFREKRKCFKESLWRGEVVKNVKLFWMSNEKILNSGFIWYEYMLSSTCIILHIMLNLIQSLLLKLVVIKISCLFEQLSMKCFLQTIETPFSFFVYVEQKD